MKRCDTETGRGAGAVIIGSGVLLGLTAAVLGRIRTGKELGRNDQETH